MATRPAPPRHCNGAGMASARCPHVLILLDPASLLCPLNPEQFHVGAVALARPAWNLSYPGPQLGSLHSDTQVSSQMSPPQRGLSRPGPGLHPTGHCSRTLRDGRSRFTCCHVPCSRPALMGETLSLAPQSTGHSKHSVARCERRPEPGVDSRLQTSTVGARVPKPRLVQVPLRLAGAWPRDLDHKVKQAGSATSQSVLVHC